MNILDVLAALRRRWYIVLVGLVVAGAAGYSTWTVVQPEYTRSATQLLLPGASDIPEGANPFLYVGGLSQAADILVRTVGSEDALADVSDRYPGLQAGVTRDPGTGGPVIVITVTAVDEKAAQAALDDLLRASRTTLADLQAGQQIGSADRIRIIPLSVDSRSTLEQRNRMLFTAGAALGCLLLSILLVALIDGMARRRAMKRARVHSAKNADDTPEDAERAAADGRESDPDPLTAGTGEPEAHGRPRASDTDDVEPADGSAELELTTGGGSISDDGGRG